MINAEERARLASPGAPPPACLDPGSLDVGSLAGQVAAGAIVILYNDMQSPPTGSLMMAADAVSADAINFMARHGRGLICLSLTARRALQLGLTLQPRRGPPKVDMAFTDSIEARSGVTTGISTADRARTVAVAAAAAASPEDLVSPGHVFPAVASDGGLLERCGHTEASLDLLRMAGHQPVAVFCQILDEQGQPAGREGLLELAARHGLSFGLVSDLARHRAAHARRQERPRAAFAPEAG